MSCVWLANKFDSKGLVYAGHQAELIVQRTALEKAHDKSGTWLVGYVTNMGEHPWRVHELEVRFLDANGKLADACHPSVSQPFVVEPHRENAFRVALGGLSLAGSNFVEQVRVEVATDGNRDERSD